MTRVHLITNVVQSLRWNDHADGGGDLNDKCGIVIGGRNIWNLRYADDTTLIATTKQELELQAPALVKHSLTFGLKVNPAKTFVMAFTNNPQPVLLNDELVEQVEQLSILDNHR